MHADQVKAPSLSLFICRVGGMRFAIFLYDTFADIGIELTGR